MLFWLWSVVLSVGLAYAFWGFFSSSTSSRCSFLKSILKCHRHGGGEQEEEEEEGGGGEKLSTSSKDKKGSHNKHRHHHSQKKYNPSATCPEQDGGGGKSIHGGSSASTSLAASKHHPLHGDVLKGVSKFCTGAAITPDGAVAAIAGSDMTLHLFDLSGGLLKSSSSQQGVVHQPSRPHIVSRVEGESLSAIDFLGNSSSSSIRIAGALENYRRLVIFELKKTDGEKKKSLVEVYRGEVALQKNRVRWLVASKGASHQWICTASEEDDTEIHVWSVSGECLASVDTKQVQTFQFSSSPLDTRFVGCAAWSPGVKLYEIKNKNGLFAKMEKAMDLKTSQGTKCVAISADNRRCVTLDKSGLLTLWNIDVRYFVSEDPKPLFSVDKALEASISLSSSSGKNASQSMNEDIQEEEDPVVRQAFPNHVSQLAFSPDGKILICIAGCHIKFLQIEENKKKIFPIALIRYAHQRSIDTLLVPQQISSSPFILTAALDSRPQLWHLPDLSASSS